MTPSNLTDTELIAETWRNEARLGALAVTLGDKRARRIRSAKLIGGALGTFVGLFLTPPTFGLSAFFAGLGLVLGADGVRDDAILYNQLQQALPERRALLERQEHLKGEMIARGLIRNAG